MNGGHPSQAAASPTRVVVSVHDVSPANLDEVRWLLARLDALGGRPRVLKVIPNEAGRAALGESRELVDLLRTETAGGSELVLHGYTHRAEGPLQGALLDRLRARLFAGHAAEFLTLGPAEAERRIAAGRTALAETAAAPLGFCPPAWLAPADLGERLLRHGFRYFVTFSAIHDLAAHRRRTIPAIGCMGSDRLQEGLVALERVAVLGLERLQPAALPVVRVFLHPQRASRSRACSAVLRSLERLLRDRTPVTYAALLDV